MKKSQKYKFLLCFLFLLLTTNYLLLTDVHGDTHTATTCSQTDVQSAINAASDGDTVMLPAGTATWTTQVTCTNKGITIRGAGMTQTNIIDGTSFGQTPLVITGQDGKPWRITELAFPDATSTVVQRSEEVSIDIYGTCRSWRIDHCRFSNTHCNTGGIRVGYNGSAYSYGLIDHCTFYFHVYSNNAIWVGCDNDTAWTRPLTLGTSNAVYVEDCYFDDINPPDSPENTNAIHTEHGARTVFRHNVLNDKVEVFGSCNSGTRGSVSFEIYDNVFFGPGTEIVWVALGIQGGAGVLFNNTIENGAVYAVNPFILFDDRTCDWFNCSGYLNVRCDGTSSIDGNLPGMMGWPCHDQVGRGPGTEVVSGKTIQKSEPVYEWNNIRNGTTDINFTLHNEGTCTTPPVIADHIQAGRDYYVDTPRPGYTPYQYPHPLQYFWDNDTSSPTAPGTVRDGTSTIADSGVTYSTTTLSANWTNSSDTESGIVNYQYAIGTTAGGTNVTNWTALGNVLTITKTGLSLIIGTTYYFSVKAINGSGLTGTATNSNGQYISSQVIVDSSEVVITNIQATNITANSVTIIWTTDKQATSQVQYGLTAGYGSQTTEDSNLNTNHSVNIIGLTAGRTYHYRVISKDSNGNQEVSGDYTFSTPTTQNPVSDSKTYPNPGDFSNGQVVKFKVQSSKFGEVKIFTMSGKLIRKISGTNEISWDGANENGERVVRGVYLYQITDSNGDKTIGKIAIR